MTERWLDSIEARARDVLPELVHRYFAQGARGGVSAAEAAAAWEGLRVAPRVLQDVTDPVLGTSMLGTAVTLPLGMAPTTLQRMAHPDGELAVARAVAEAGSLMVVSSNAGTTFAEIGTTGAAWWLQAYLPQDRSIAEPLLARAVEAGARAVVLTVDTPVVGTKYDDGPTIWEGLDPGMLRANFDPAYDDLPGSGKALDLGPADIDWIQKHTGLPVVVKGVLRPDDARRCVQAGAAAIWVSNHGGRQLDRTVSTVAALPDIVSSVGRAAEVYVDGGVRSGLDLVLATALGATAAFVGRPVLWALALDGQFGVATLLESFRTELTEAMRLSGAASLADTPGLVPMSVQTGVDLRKRPV
ncbi:MAG: FMN-dependent alpha-hydroxy acid dehydrogenase [Marmoricola sp.]|nr:FMN-dependent alpha-hydroxy acid dehydrogenase [Marmoricola sp.]